MSEDVAASAVTAEAGEPTVGSPAPSGKRHIKLSWSRLSTYLKCGESFRLSYIEEVPKIPSGAMLAGKAEHTAIEKITVDGSYSDPFYVEGEAKVFVLEEFRRLVEEAGGPDACRWGGRKRNLKDENTGKDVLDENGNKVKTGEDFRWMNQMLPLWLKRAATILRNDERRGLHVVQANVERTVSAWLIRPESDLPYTADIVGVIDVMLLADDYGQPVIRDWKTGTLMDPMQLAVYAWLLEQVEDPNQRISTTKGEMVYLRGTSSESWLKEHDLTEWKPIVPNLFHGMLKGVNAEVFPLVPSSFCTSCWVRENCTYGRTLKVDDVA